MSLDLVRASAYVIALSKVTIHEPFGWDVLPWDGRIHAVYLESSAPKALRLHAIAFDLTLTARVAGLLWTR